MFTLYTLRAKVDGDIAGCIHSNGGNGLLHTNSGIIHHRHFLLTSFLQ